MKSNVNWIYKVFLLTFILSIVFSGVSAAITNSFNEIVLFIILLLTILLGIVFDMIGVAFLTSEEASLHARAAQKIAGAKEAIALLKNGTKVSSVCQDVIGDICGIISGSLGAVLTISLVDLFNLPNLLTTIIITAVISSLTVGCKAISKEIASKNSDKIVFTVGKIIHFISFKK
jgi:CBS domain containing-hemolysin-like protein